MLVLLKSMTDINDNVQSSKEKIEDVVSLLRGQKSPASSTTASVSKEEEIITLLKNIRDSQSKGTCELRTI